MSVNSENTASAIAVPASYGGPLHQTLRQAVSDLQIPMDLADLDRALVDDVAAEEVDRALGVFATCGIAAVPIAPTTIPRSLRPGTVVVGLGKDHHVVLSPRNSRSVNETLISTKDRFESRARTSLRALESCLFEPMQWLSISAERDLTSMARPGGTLAPWARLWELLRIERKDVGVVALYAATLGALTLLFPIATQALVNTIAFGAIVQPLIVMTVALFVGLALAGVVSALQAYVVEVLQRRILVRVAEDFAVRIPQVADSARDRKDLRELTNRFFDVITVQKSSAELLLTGLALLLQTAVGLLLLGFYHPVLLGFDLVLLLLIGAVLTLGRGGTASAIEESRAKFELAAWLHELARAPEHYSGGQGGVVAAEQTSKRAMDYVQSRKRHYRTVFSVLVGGIGLQVFAVVGLLGVGGWLVIERQLTLGQLVAAEIIVSAIAVGIAKFGRLADKTFDLVAATDKLGKLLDLPVRQDGITPLEKDAPAMAIEAKAVRAGYAGTSVHPGVSFSVAPGQKCLLGGPAASGRSALLETLAGDRTPVAGTVLWDGHSRPKLDDLKTRALLTSHHVVAGSVFDNLRLADAGLSTTEAWAALEAVGLSTDVDALAKGLDAKLLPSGSPLSKTQVRRLALARALVAKPGLLLVDETLDHLGECADDQDRLIELFVGPQAPWTAIVATRDPRVAAHLTTDISLAQAKVAAEKTEQ